MLSLNDVKGIARSRFYLKSPWKWEEWVLNIVAVWVIVVMLGALGVMFSRTSSEPVVKYVIPQSIIEQGEDVQVMYQWGIGDTVNGYLLQSPKTDSVAEGWISVFLWTMGILLFTPIVLMAIWSGVKDYSLNKYRDEFAQLWVANKELPEKDWRSV